MKIMNVYPTRLDIMVEKKRIKKVPVEAILNLKFADGYDLSSKVHWYPDSVYITGPLESPYEGAIFRMSIKFPDNFPFKPPQVRFLDKIYPKIPASNTS